jgi:hypothetical protein
MYTLQMWNYTFIASVLLALFAAGLGDALQVLYS